MHRIMYRCFAFVAGLGTRKLAKDYTKNLARRHNRFVFEMPSSMGLRAPMMRGPICCDQCCDAV